MQIYEVDMRSSEHQALARRMVAESVFRPWKRWKLKVLNLQSKASSTGYFWLVDGTYGILRILTVCINPGLILFALYEFIYKNIGQVQDWI